MSSASRRWAQVGCVACAVSVVLARRFRLSDASQVLQGMSANLGCAILPAGAISKTVTAPVETLRMQVMSGKVRPCRRCMCAQLKHAVGVCCATQPFMLLAGSLLLLLPRHWCPA